MNSPNTHLLILLWTLEKVKSERVLELGCTIRLSQSAIIEMHWYFIGECKEDFVSRLNELSLKTACRNGLYCTFFLIKKYEKIKNRALFASSTKSTNDASAHKSSSGSPYLASLSSPSASVSGRPLTKQ